MSAQQNGRFATLKSQAFDLFDRGRYSEVIGKLEEVWEQDHSDVRVAEYLAMGFLYGEKDIPRAKAFLGESLAGGGRATLIVHHSHERSLLAGDVMNNYCSGRMAITPGNFAFIADSGEHSMTLTPGDLKSIRILGGKPGRVEIKTSSRTYVFGVKSETHAEAALLEDLIKQTPGKK